MMKIMKNVLYCFYCFVRCGDSLRAASAEVCCRQFGMRSYSAMERQSAAATGVKKETPDSHGFVPGESWWIMVNPGDAW